MKIFRLLVLFLMAVGIPLQGFATASQSFCRVSNAAMHAMHSDMGHSAHHEKATEQTAAQPVVDAQTLSDAMHQCGHCAQCAAAHAMASWPTWATHWPKSQPIWVGAVPKLHGRTLTYAPERPPRALTA